MARELHDSVTQRLFGVVLAAETAGELLDRDADAARAQLERASELAHGAMEELRSLIFELRPAALDDEGLAAALRKHLDILRRVHDMDIALRVAGTPRLGPAADSQVFRIAQEAVNNALRHAGARRIAVALRCARRPLHAARRGRRRRLRPGRARAPGAAPRPDLDGGARAGARRHARDRVAPRRGDERDARGGRVIRVLIADDHAVVRQGLRTFLELHDDIEVVGEAADGEEAVRVAVEGAPDVVLVDLVMPRLGGIEAIRRIREGSPGTRVLVLTSFADDDTVLPALRAGAAGYLLKDVQPRDLVGAIRTVHRGEALLAPAVATMLVEQLGAGAEPVAAGRRADRRASARSSRSWRAGWRTSASRASSASPRGR